MNSNLDTLRKYLNEINPGPVSDSAKIEAILAECWNELDSRHDGGMEANKLGAGGIVLPSTIR